MSTWDIVRLILLAVQFTGYGFLVIVIVRDLRRIGRSDQDQGHEAASSDEGGNSGVG